VTLLVGKNNTGKTNLGRALRFVGACAGAEDIDSAAKQAGMAPSEVVSRHVRNEPTELHLEIDLPHTSGRLAYEYSLVLESRDPGRELTHLLTVSSEQGQVVTAEGQRRTLLERQENRASVSLGGHHEVFEVPPWQSALFGLQTRMNDLLPLIERVRSWRMYNVHAGPRPNFGKAQYDAYLTDGGSNLNSALYSLKNEDERTFATLIKLVQEIEPSLFTLNFIRPRPEEVWMEVEDVEGNRYGPESLSDGTIHYMALCYIALHSQIRTHRDATAPALAFIEEPDAGLYVGHLRRMFEVLQTGSDQQQIILTTHNPYLMDLFEDRLEQVRLVSRGDCQLRDSTKVSELNAEQVSSLLAEMPLGELLYRGLLQ